MEKKGNLCIMISVISLFHFHFPTATTEVTVHNHHHTLKFSFSLAVRVFLLTASTSQQQPTAHMHLPSSILCELIFSQKLVIFYCLKKLNENFSYNRKRLNASNHCYIHNL